MSTPSTPEPSISIEQKTTSRSPRSTVGTITEIYDYLRLLYSSIDASLPTCGNPITRQSAKDRAAVMAHARRPVMIMAPIVADEKGEFKKEMEKLVQHDSAALVSTAN